jgi:transposase
VRILAASRAGQAACSMCGVPSRRVHSRYQRQLADTEAGRQEVLVHLQVPRFFCGNTSCARTPFAEQVPGLSSRYGRRTRGLDAALRAIALALVTCAARPRQPSRWPVKQ